MDINDLRSVGTVLAFLAFIAVCVWAYGGRRKQQFEDASRLPFADETDDRITSSRTQIGEHVP